MGLYYSIWDWFNPYWPEEDQPTRRNKPCNDVTLKKYIHEVMYPQFKEIVEKYEPALIFSDGDWWMDDERWETKPLLAWLFNNAPNKDEVDQRSLGQGAQEAWWLLHNRVWFWFCRS